MLNYCFVYEFSRSNVSNTEISDKKNPALTNLRAGFLFH